MPLARAMVRKGGVISDELMPGDLQATGRSIANIATVGAGLWTGAAIAQGIIRRTGPIAGYTDTTDSAVNILTALRGNAPLAEVLQGVSFETTIINTVAFAHTFAAGAGIVAGTQGASLNIPASTSANFLWTIKNSDPTVTLNSNITNASPTVTFVLPAGLNALKIGPAPDAVNITPGMSVTGTNIPAGTTVLGVRQGQGGLIGVTLSGNATATVQQVLTFGPTIEVNSLYAG